MASGLVMASAEMETTVFMFCTTVVICAVYWFFGHDSRRLPPGPFCLPIVGYLPFLTWKPYIKLQELQKKYGPVYRLWFGSRYVVVLCDFRSIREAFSQDAFMGRPTESFFEFSKATIDTGAINGIRWKEQRRFSLHMLRDLGFGKTRMEDHIREEIYDLLERFEKIAGKPIEAKKIFAPSMSNNISSVVFGRRMKFDDPKRIMLDGILADSGRLIGQMAWQIFFPWIKKVSLCLRLGKHNQLTATFNAMKGFVQGEIAEHEKTLDSTNVRDYIDGYLLEIEKHKDDPNTTFQKGVLEDMVGAFFGAGSETVKIVVDWQLLTMAAFHDVQMRVQREIDDVLGERFPTRADYQNMPFTEAVIMELMRWRTITPINFFRYTLKETQLNSYTIPKDAFVLANLWGVHHDPKLWGQDVEDFKPERFLSKDGTEFHKPEYYIPFSIGKRSCPGEALANVEIFLYFTAILQKFSVRLPAGAEPNFEGVLGIALQAKPYELILEIRK